MSEQAVVFPLRSNAKSLVAGGPVDSVRRKIKYASLFYETVLLEAGVLRLQAGLSGHFSVVEPARQDCPPVWESAAARWKAQQQPFVASMGRETIPGLPAPSTYEVVPWSEPVIAWTATFEPFGRELPAGVNWIEFAPGPRQLSAALDWLSRVWSSDDRRNRVLAGAVAAPRVRDLIIRNTNYDLAAAYNEGFAAAVDPLHAQVVNRRFQDDVIWKAQGFALPISLPQVADLGWDEIVRIRANRQVSRFRDMLRDVEAEVAGRSPSEGLEAAVRRVYSRGLGAAIGEVEGIGGPAGRTIQGLVFGIAGGLATMGIGGIGALAAGPAAGAVLGGVFDVRKMLKRKKSAGWATVHQQITGVGT
jgi:hypothetical protein